MLISLMRRYVFVARLLQATAISAVCILAGCVTPPAEQAGDVRFYFVGDTPQGFRLFSEWQDVGESGVSSPEQIIGALVQGDIQPQDPDYTNLWDSSHSLRGIEVVDGVATIDLDLGTLNVGAEAEQRAIDQLVWTLTGIDQSINQVLILVEGAPVESLAGHVDATGGFTRGDGLDVLSPLQIVSPHQGAEVTLPVTITGEACTFEANVVWGLYKEGVLLEEGFTTAESACPDRSAWSVELGDLEPGTYTFSAQEFSAEDGALRAEDSKSFYIP